MVTIRLPSEKRRHPRLSLVLRASFHGLPPAHYDWTENLSAGGLFIRTEHHVELGQLVDLTLSFPGLLADTRIQGRVTWIRGRSPMAPPGIGVELVTDAQRQQLAQIVLTVLKPPALNSAQSFRVLIAEDNEKMTKSYERGLNALSKMAQKTLQVRFVGDGGAVLHEVAEHGADLILLDVYMPVMDGLTVIERLKADPRWRKIPLLVVTAGDGDEAERAEALGAEAFLRKPIQIGDLLETIACLIASRAST